MPAPRWPPGNGLSRSLSGCSETDRERGSAVGVLYRSQVMVAGLGAETRRAGWRVVGGTGYERGTLGVRGDVSLWVRSRHR